MNERAYIIHIINRVVALQTQKQGPSLRPLWVGTNPYHFGFSGFCFVFSCLFLSSVLPGASLKFVFPAEKTQNLPNLESMTSKTRDPRCEGKTVLIYFLECSQGGVAGNGWMKLYPRGTRRKQGSFEEAPVLPHGCSSQVMVPEWLKGCFLLVLPWSPKDSSFSNLGSPWDESRRHV